VRGSLRGEDESLTDQLALGVLGDGNSVGARARSAADESALGVRVPATMADVCELDLAVVGVGRGSNEHAETLLERGGLSAGNVVDVKTAIVDEVSLRSSVSDLRDAAVCRISMCSVEGYR